MSGGAAFLLKGIAIGLSIAAPVGPIGVLCIRRTLAEGRVRGLVSGLGAAAADALYGCVAGFGLTILSDVLIGQQTWFRLIGGAFLCYLGVKTYLAQPGERAVPEVSLSLLGAFSSTFLLTLTNPVTILSFGAIFAGLGLADSRDGGAIPLVVGVFSGSALWWLTLSSAVSLFRHRFGPGGLRWTNRVSGLVIAGFGLGALVSSLV
ncbi:MAG: LysE family transporter [Anaerolineae bacterium]|nr:LysE family transporter [Anaerolineae bacterium]